MPADNCHPGKRERADELLTTLSDSIRREIIHYFENYTEESNSSLDELATHIAERMPAESQENLMLKLPQTHLSKLQSRGWVSYDKQTGQIRYHGNEEAKQLLADVREMF
ncbi:DUF7344 domain-containing protein [Haloarchaeobius litoreus]|uniref:DUF7344 domain-containing protein n=1 Tax=Haloarchaeobius litoreus TaxID=755306 RepID=UPI003F5EC8D6